jgi:hypothetical protein
VFSVFYESDSVDFSRVTVRRFDRIGSYCNSQGRWVAKLEGDTWMGTSAPAGYGSSLGSNPKIYTIHDSEILCAVFYELMPNGLFGTVPVPCRQCTYSTSTACYSIELCVFFCPFLDVYAF